MNIAIGYGRRMVRPVYIKQRGGNAVKLEKVCEDRIRVWLSDEELRDWGVTYDTLQQGTPSTDRLMRQVLRKVRRQYGVWDRCTVEAVPIDGGCVMLVSLQGVRTTLGDPLVCRVQDEQALFSLAEQLAANAPVPSSSLYALPWGYILVLHAGDRLTPLHRRLAAEYSHTISGVVAVAAVGEYGHLLTSDGALEQLTGCVPSAPVPPEPAH